jgi:hypothetical protein
MRHLIPDVLRGAAAMLTDANRRRLGYLELLQVLGGVGRPWWPWWVLGGRLPAFRAPVM